MRTRSYSIDTAHNPSILMAAAKQPPASNAADKSASAAAGVGIGFDRLVGAMRVVLAVSLVCATVVQSRSILARAYSIRLHAIETYGYGELLLCVMIHISGQTSSRFVSFSHHIMDMYIFGAHPTPPHPAPPHRFMFRLAPQSSTNSIPTLTSEPPSTCTTTVGNGSPSGSITRFGTPSAVPSARPYTLVCR